VNAHSLGGLTLAYTAFILRMLGLTLGGACIRSTVHMLRKSHIYARSRLLCGLRFIDNCIAWRGCSLGTRPMLAARSMARARAIANAMCLHFAPPPCRVHDRTWRESLNPYTAKRLIALFSECGEDTGSLGILSLVSYSHLRPVPV